MQEITFDVDNLVQLRATIPEIIDHLAGPVVVILKGELGAGKTTLVREICGHLGVQDAVTSPTFSLIQEYRTGSDEPVFHVDLYRLQHAAELTEIGILDILESGRWVFVEWPELAAEVLPKQYRSICIESEGGQQRKIVIS